MEFWRESLRAVLREQVELVGVLDATGKKVREVSALFAAEHYGDNYIGVGNRRRIRFIKPVNTVRVPPMIGEQIRDAILGDPRMKRHRVQKNMKTVWREGHTWPTQQSRARTGQGGRLKTIFVERQ